MIDRIHNLLNETRTEWKCLESVLSDKEDFKTELGILSDQTGIDQGIAKIKLEIKYHKKAYFEQLNELLKFKDDE